MVLAERKELYRDLKSIIASSSCDWQADLISGWFSCPKEGSSSVLSLTQENCKLYYSA